jgi:Tol biopolymer transport system component
MGEVYRARDPRLNREVAVKALPASAARDAERVGRFEREAQILATLNHPHIAALYGIEDVAGTDASASARFIVLELLDGGSLADRLRTGPLPVREALAVARQVADALHAAHDKGIIHRDIKPANIAFTADGHAKVLDFGLAKAFAAMPDAETAMFGATASGIVLGTAAYMSPEQARALPADKRADIWAFGCVLYEMLAGQHPFTAATLPDVVTRVLNDDPDWTRLPAATPPRVRWLLRRCLEKEPRQRLHDIADARIELDEVLSGTIDSSPAVAVEGVGQSGARRASRERLVWAGAVLGLLAIVATLAYRDRLTRDAAGSGDQVHVTSIVLPPGVQLIGPDPARFALSPDGTRLAFTGATGSGPAMLWIRPLNSTVAQSIPGTEGASHPFWSPDSASVAFTARPKSNVVGGVRGQLKKVDIAGNKVTTIAADVRFMATGAWGPGNVILFTPSGDSPIYRVAASGGEPTAVTTLDKAKGDVQHSYPHVLPDGRTFLFSAVGSQSGGATDIQGVYAQVLDSTAPRRLVVERGSHASYANGHLLFVRETTLFAQPFDVDRLELSGQPVPVAERILAGGVGAGVSAAYTVTDTGLLAYQTSASIPSQLRWFNRDGSAGETVGGPGEYADVVLSKDGTRLATSIRDPESGSRDIWIVELARGFFEQFTLTREDEFAPVWSETGNALAYSAVRGGSIDLYRRAAGGAEEKLDQSAPGLGKFAASWSPDGNWILYIAGARIIARSDLMLLPLAGSDRQPRVFADSDSIETQGRFSPDGRWIAYSTSGGSRREVYVSPFPVTGTPPKRVSISGGGWPQWRRDGAELFFIDEQNQVNVASVDGSGKEFQVGDVRALFAVPIQQMARLDAYAYDVSPDGKRFLVNTRTSSDLPSTPITFIANWPAALAR